MDQTPKRRRRCETEAPVFAIPRAVARHLPDRLEVDIKNEVEAILKASKTFFRRIQIQGAVVHGVHGARMMQSSMTGMSDIIGCLNGQMFAIELKRPKGMVKQSQIDFSLDLVKAGGKACILIDPTKLMSWLLSATWKIQFKGVDIV